MTKHSGIGVAARAIAGVAAILVVGVFSSPQPATAARSADESAPSKTKPTGLGEAIDRDVARIREATAAFRSLDAAVGAGYAGNVQHCIENPPAGGMGYHHQNDALMDDRLEVERPEILVYERMAGGGYRLNGVEYIVPFSIWPPEREPPTVMGQELKPAPGLKLWYLHAWVWLDNPSGLFADWNPRVKCRR